MDAGEPSRGGALRGGGAPHGVLTGLDVMLEAPGALRRPADAAAATAAEHIVGWFAARMPERAGAAPPVPASAATRILVVKAETGAGKSYALPVYLLRLLRGAAVPVTPAERKARGIPRPGAPGSRQPPERPEPGVVSVQPRALTVKKLAEALGADPALPDLVLGETVGHESRASARPPRAKAGATLRYMTNGAFWQRVRSEDAAEIGASFRFIVLDEVHDMSADLALVCAALRRLYTPRVGPDGEPRPLPRSTPFLVVTSATMDSERFLDFFGLGPENLVEVAGRVNPITDLDFLGAVGLGDARSFAAAAARGLPADASPLARELLTAWPAAPPAAPSSGRGRGRGRGRGDGSRGRGDGGDGSRDGHAAGAGAGDGAPGRRGLDLSALAAGAVRWLRVVEETELSRAAAGEATIPSDVSRIASGGQESGAPRDASGGQARRIGDPRVPLGPPGPSGGGGAPRDILVFLPSTKTIDAVADALARSAPDVFFGPEAEAPPRGQDGAGADPRGAGGVLVLKLTRPAVQAENEDYRLLTATPEEFAARGLPVPERRVVLATNVAESGVTIPTLRYVVDSGFQDGTAAYWPEGARAFLRGAAARASLEQRRGRAGRVAAGYYVPLYLPGAAAAAPRNQVPELVREGAARGELAAVMALDPAGRLRLGPRGEMPVPAPPPGWALFAALEELLACGGARGGSAPLAPPRPAAAGSAPTGCHPVGSGSEGGSALDRLDPHKFSFYKPFVFTDWEFAPDRMPSCRDEDPSAPDRMPSCRRGARGVKGGGAPLPFTELTPFGRRLLGLCRGRPESLETATAAVFAHALAAGAAGLDALAVAAVLESGVAAMLTAPVVAELGLAAGRRRADAFARDITDWSHRRADGDAGGDGDSGADGTSGAAERAVDAARLALADLVLESAIVFEEAAGRFAELGPEAFASWCRRAGIRPAAAASYRGARTRIAAAALGEGLNPFFAAGRRLIAARAPWALAERAVHLKRALVAGARAGVGRLAPGGGTAAFVTRHGLRCVLPAFPAPVRGFLEALRRAAGLPAGWVPRDAWAPRPWVRPAEGEPSGFALEITNISVLDGAVGVDAALGEIDGGLTPAAGSVDAAGPASAGTEK